MPEDRNLRSDEKPIIVVHILSVSYSGSTWINLMLGSHPEGFSVGELKSVLKKGRPIDTIHGDESPVWSNFDMNSDENPFRQIARISGKRILIVNNSRKFFQYHREPGIEPRFIHLVRDGRAVVASFLRKFPERSLWQTARMWNHDTKRIARHMRRERPEWCVQLSYERATKDPEAELRRVCEAVDLEFHPAMLEYWNREHYYLGGNRGTLFSLARKRDPESGVVVGEKKVDGNTAHWDLEYYKKQDLQNFRDERWKEELSDRQLRIFALAAGRLNRKLGYPRSLDRS